MAARFSPLKEGLICTRFLFCASAGFGAASDVVRSSSKMAATGLRIAAGGIETGGNYAANKIFKEIAECILRNETHDENGNTLEECIEQGYCCAEGNNVSLCVYELNDSSELAV